MSGWPAAACVTTSGGGEGETDLGIDGDLRHPGYLVLDRVFDGDDLHGGLVEPIERAIQRRGLPRASRAGDEDDAVRLADQVLELLEQPARHAELGQVAYPGAPVEDAQHDALSVQARCDRHAHVELAIGEPQTDAAVLSEAPFRDVQAGHDLYAADDRGLMLAGGGGEAPPHALAKKAPAPGPRAPPPV